MKIINLRDYYPNYQQDYFTEVPDEIAALLARLRQDEENHRLRTYRNKAYYSLDCEDGIENEILFSVKSLDEVYEHKLTMEQLYSAIANLPDKQAKRIYAHFFLGLSKTAIAKAEGIGENAVRDTIERGLRNMEKFLKNFS